MAAPRKRKPSDEQLLKMASNDRLLRGFKVWRVRWWRMTLKQSNPEIIKLLRYLRTMPPLMEQDFIDWLPKTDWLMRSPPDVRLLVLRSISRRQDRQRGFDLDDPMPPADDMFFKAKTILGVR